MSTCGPVPARAEAVGEVAIAVACEIARIEGGEEDHVADIGVIPNDGDIAPKIGWEVGPFLVVYVV